MYFATHDPLEIACCSQTQYQLHFATTPPIAHSKALDPRTTHTNQLKKNHLWECIRITGRCTEAVGFRYVSFHASEGSYSKKKTNPCITSWQGCWAGYPATGWSIKLFKKNTGWQPVEISCFMDRTAIPPWFISFSSTDDVYMQHVPQDVFSATVKFAD